MKYCWRNMKCLSDMKWLRHEVKFALMCEAHFIVSTTSYTAGVLHLPQANFIEKRTCFCKCVFLVPLTGLEGIRVLPPSRPAAGGCPPDIRIWIVRVRPL